MLNLPSTRGPPLPERNIHPTYSTKPKPELQAISQSSQFQDNTRASLAYRAPTDIDNVPSVPTTWDTVYDPEHPSADWSGLVSKEAVFAKKHVLDHPSHREGIERTPHGIISKQERQEFPRKRSNNESAAKNSGSLVIGGIDNPNERFKTSYNRFEQQEETSKEQMALDKRLASFKELANRSSLQSARQGAPQSSNPIYADENIKTREIKYNPRANLLSNLGESLSRSCEPPPVQTQSEYRSEQYRTMVGENFKPFPGYTGRRR